MEIPVAIHKDDGSVYGVTVPDIPGCHSWGETIDDAMKNVKKAIYDHLETLLMLNEPVNVKVSQIENLATHTQYANGIWALVNIDLAKIDAKPERINVSIPRFVLKRIDSYAASRHETRSGFLSRAALNLISQESGRSEHAKA